jgi:hypothetical protein
VSEQVRAVWIRKSKPQKRWSTWRVLAVSLLTFTLIYLVMVLAAGIVFYFKGQEMSLLLWTVFLFAAAVDIALLSVITPRSQVAVPFQDRIIEAREYLIGTGRILRDLEDELNTRTKVLEQLHADADRYERLVSLNVEQAKAIEDMVGRQFERQLRITWWQWWGSIALAIIFGFVVNWASVPLWDWLTR